jgi:hypothetical protein
MPLPSTTNDRWQTTDIIMSGGMIGSVDEITLAHRTPGALSLGSNFESGLRGGYRRISGYIKFETTAVPGTGAVLGVSPFPNTGIIAARADKIYYSSGSGGWTQINTDTRSVPAKVRFDLYNFGSDKIIIVDGTNAPVTFDGTSYVKLTTAPVGAFTAINYGNYMFLAKGSQLTFSAPGNETDYNPANGAGVINVGFPIVGLATWRQTLYIFGTNHISSLKGTIFGGTTPDAILSAVTNNVGCIAPDTIQELSGDILYLAQDGIRTISGTTRIGDIELAAITDPIHEDFIQFSMQYPTSAYCTVVCHNKNQYRIFAANSGTDASASAGWNICIRNTSQSYTGTINNYEFFQFLGINAACSNSGYVGLNEYIVHGSYDGWVYRQEQGNTFDGAGIPAVLRLPYNGFDDPELRKTFYKMKVNLIAEGPSQLNCQLSFDYGAPTSAQPNRFAISAINGMFSIYGVSIYGTHTYGGNPNQNSNNNILGSGLNMALVFTSNDPGSYPYTVRSVIMDYQVNGRR